MPHLHHAALGSSASLFLNVTIALTALVYLRGWLHLRFNPVIVISAWRACSFLVGLLLIWVAVASPIAGLDHELLTVHMLQHLLLMTLAPPLIWLADPVRSVMYGLPERSVRILIRVLQKPSVQKMGKVFARPEFCWIAASAALVGWHVPALFTVAMRSSAWHFVEHASFLATGILFWWPVVQPWPSTFRADLSIILYLFFATLPCDILSGFLVFCDRVVYPIYFSSSHLFGFSALADQQCAAALMWTCVTVVYLVAGTILTMQLLSPQRLHQHHLVQAKMRRSGIPEGLEAL